MFGMCVGLKLGGCWDEAKAHKNGIKEYGDAN